MCDDFNLKEFGEAIESIVSEDLGCLYDVRVLNMIKNNGLSLCGLSIRCGESNIAPIIYLNDYYIAYIEGREFNDIIYEIIEVYMKSNKNIPSIKKDFNWESLKDNIIIKLINYDMNKQMLDELPYKIVFSNLSIIFQVLVGSDKDGIHTFKVTNELIKRFEVNVDELYSLALYNTKKWFPATLRNMNEVIANIIQSEMGDSADFEEIWDTLSLEKSNSSMYVLSNTIGINGSVALLYPDIIKEFAETMNTDLYILPSSTHEVIIVLEYGKNYNIKALKEMVSNVNNEQVPLEDVLSNSVYQYKRSIGEIIML